MPPIRIRSISQIIAGRRSDEALAVLVQAVLARVGFAVHIHTYSPAVYSNTAAQGGIILGGHYDATVYTWIAGMDPDNASQFLCGQRPPDGSNDSFYCTPEMDAAQAAALTAYDRPARKRAYGRIESLLLRDVPIVFIGAQTDTTALRTVIDGFAPNPITPSASAQHWEKAGEPR